MEYQSAIYVILKTQASMRLQRWPTSEFLFWQLLVSWVVFRTLKSSQRILILDRA
jgi:hypothetical protein